MSCSEETKDDEQMNLESGDEDAQLPSDVNSLICEGGKTRDEKQQGAKVCKCLNMDAGVNTLTTTPKRQCLKDIDNVTQSGQCNSSTGEFKRLEPTARSSTHMKRYKSENDHPATAGIMQLPQLQLPSKRSVLKKSMSMNDAVCFDALSRTPSESDLIGDFSRGFSLPYIEGAHANLKSISCEVMRQLLSGEFKDSVASYKIIDCRYPYEYEGGHIRGAINLYMQDQILDELIQKNNEPIPSDGLKRSILIFHCEFSSKRGPRL